MIRENLIKLILLLGSAGFAMGQAPVISMSASAVVGPAPLQVTLTATCDTCVKYLWKPGDSGLIPNGTSTSAMYIYNKVGNWTASVIGTDANGVSATASVPVNVSLVPLGENDYCSPDSEWLGAHQDEVAALPKNCIYTGMDKTPAPGNTIVVSSPDITGLNFALSQASCGDTVVIPSGMQMVIPTWTLTNKPCDNDHWVIIRGGGTATLPSEHTRLTPCYAGQASLPNMPPYPCPTPVNAIPKLSAKGAAPVIAMAPGANHYRIMFLEINKPPAQTVKYSYGLVDTNGSDHIVIDRVWIHGSPAAGEESKRGINLTDSTNVAVINSYINDFKCISLIGTCTDAQAIQGGDGVAAAEGPWKIYNNFLNSSTENILFGGGGKGVTTPLDIEIRENHLYRPDIWNPKNPAYTPPAPGSNGYTVKNGWEIKNAGQLLFEGNTIEYSWGGFTQLGWCWVYTPRGVWGQATDITARFNKCSHTGNGVQLGASKATSDPGSPDSKAAYGWSIHDNVMDDMNSVYYNGSGLAWQLGSNYTVSTSLHDVSIYHNTILNATDPSALMTLGAMPNPVPVKNIFLNDNILRAAAKFNVWSIGSPGMICPRSGQPFITFSQCWQNWSVTNNVIIGYAAPLVSKNFGSFPGNFLTVDPIGTAASVQFVNFSNANGGDYHLQATSPYHNKATDGTDLGANIDAVNSAVQFSK